MKKKAPGKVRRSKQAVKPRQIAKPKSTARSAPTAARDSLLTPIAGADRREVGGVAIDIVRAGNGRIKRVVYPRGFRWSTHMKPTVGTDLCMHAHVGFLARGRVHGEYADGCGFEYAAPRVVVLEPGHDAWVVGDEPAVLIQFDAEEETASRFGLPEEHRHSRL
jgi:streptogramin lyase